MTENERQEILNDIKDGYIDEWDNLVIDELFKQIEREHEEIQQYRAIGTVEEVKSIVHIGEWGYRKGYNKAIDEFAERLKELCGYEEDGFQYPYLLHESRIDEIAEEMKEGAK